MARQTRTHQIVVNIEENFHEIFVSLCEKEQISMSAKGRKLVLAYLIERGLLPTDYLLETTG